MLFVQKKEQPASRPAATPNWGEDPHVVDVESKEKPATTEKKSLLGGFSGKKLKQSDASEAPTRKPKIVKAPKSSKSKYRALVIALFGGAGIAGYLGVTALNTHSASEAPVATPPQNLQMAAPSVAVPKPSTVAIGMEAAPAVKPAAVSASMPSPSASSVGTAVTANPLQKLDVDNLIKLAASAWAPGSIVTAKFDSTKTLVDVSGPKAGSSQLPNQAGCSVTGTSPTHKSFSCPPLLQEVGAWVGPVGSDPESLKATMTQQLPRLSQTFDLGDVQLTAEGGQALFKVGSGSTQGLKLLLQGSYRDFPKLVELLTGALNTSPLAVQSLEIGKNLFSAEVVAYTQPKF